MFKLKYKNINNQEFVNSMNQLTQLSLPTKVAWNISKIQRQLDDIITKGRNEFGVQIKDLLDLDKDGKVQPAIDKEGKPIQGHVKIKEGKDAEAQKLYDEQANKEWEIKSHKIKLADLLTVHVAPNLLSDLADIIDDGTEETESGIQVPKEEPKA